MLNVKLKFIFLIFILLLANISQAQWTSDTRLTIDPAVSNTSDNSARCVATSGDNISIVWRDNRNGNNEIYYKNSIDGGLSGGTDKRLTNNPANSLQPTVSISGSIEHVGWEDNRDGNYEIYYKRSTDGGITWGTDIRLTNNSAGSLNPSLSVSGTNVHLVWRDNRDGNYEIYYKRSTDGGTTWGTDTRLTNNSADSYNPSISIVGSSVHIVWQDSRDGNEEIYYKRSSDGGMSWGADTRLTNDIAVSYNPTVAASGLGVHIVWRDARVNNTYDIFYKRSSDGGLSWGADTRLTHNTADSLVPSLAVSASNVHVVWEDNRDGNFEIYYKHSTDGGINWNPDTRLTNNPAFSFYAFVAVSSSVVHVVWYDHRDGNDEIYYKRDPTGNPTTIKNISLEIPKEFSLSQNYPNPFNPTTNIRFSIPKDGNVSLKFYDVIGNEVANYVDGFLKAGVYNAEFDGSGLSSGVYFYKLIAKDFSETKKMILSK